MSAPSEVMATSACSSLADDSGVQCDMGQSITEAEDLICDGHSDLLEKSTSSNLPDVVLETEKLKCDNNGNVEPADEIVHRRRYKKGQGRNGQKKRVSFHEDILNSTRVDDVHIERGFISYRGSGSLTERYAPVGRNSWSVSDECTLGPRHVMSDLLTYGATDANTLFSPTDSNNSNPNTESDNSTDSTPSAETPFKSFSCDYSQDNSPEMMKKQYFSEGDVNRCYEKSPKRQHSIKSVLKKKRYITTNVVEENSLKSGKMQVLESLKNFYNTFKLGLSSTTSGVPEEPSAFEATAIVDNENDTSKVIDGFVQIQLDEPPSGSTSKQLNRQQLSLNVSPRKYNESVTKCEPSIERSFILNGESTVYEHKGISYCYVNDTFNTTFDTTREKFTPIPEVDNENRSMCDSMTSSFFEDKKESTPSDVMSFKPPESTEQEKKTYVDTVEAPISVNKLAVKNNVTLRHLASPRKQNSLKRNSEISNSDLASESEKNSEFDIDDITLTKQSLLNKFLRNFQKRNNIEKLLKTNQFYMTKSKRRCLSLLVDKNLIDKTFPKSSHKLDRLINKEVLENRRISVRVMTSNQPSYYDSFEDDIALECCEKLRLELFTDPEEHLLRLVRARVSETDDCNGRWRAVAALVTSRGVRVATRDSTRYTQLAALPYSHIKGIRLGPDNQFVVIETKDGVGIKLVTGDASLTDRFVNSIMWAAAVINIYPNWHHDYLDDATLYYGEVCVAHELMSEEAWIGALQGHLMFKCQNDTKWTPAHFSLSRGVLRWCDRSLPLEHLLGARRVISTRPHCFELATQTRTQALVLAAADDQEASTWLQALLQHAAHALKPSSAPTPLTCSIANVRVTRDAVRLSRDGGDLIAYGPHRDLVAVKLPCDGGDRCQLEWSVCETSGGGVTALLFACGGELDRFLATLDSAYKEAVGKCESLPLSVCSCASGGGACSCVGAIASAALRSAMDDLLPAAI